MNKTESLRRSFSHLVTSNNLYKQNLKSHKPCQTCLSCQKTLNSLKENPKINNIEDFLSTLVSKSSQGSPEVLAFSTELTQKQICECSAYSGHKGKRIFQLKVPRLSQKTSFSTLISSEFSRHSGNFCIMADCQMKSSSFKVSCSELSNLLISTSFAFRDLRTLLAFLQGLEERLDGSSFFNTDPLYLQGMILENNNVSVYVSFETFSIFSEVETEVYPDYFFFMLLQYSLFPSVLVFNSVQLESGFSEVLNRYESSLNNFLRFLTGDRELESGLCFLCWNQSHEHCSQVLGYENWGCGCGIENPYYSMFCLNCSSGKRPLPAGCSSLCPVCSSSSTFTYCLKCSYLTDCFSCGKKIFNTQLVGCPECLNWSNSSFCKTCQADNSMRKLQCFDCFSLRVKKKTFCEHSGQTPCKLCLFDFTCAACFKGKSAFDPRFCWKCRNELIDDFCLCCQQLNPHSSLVCAECVLSIKKCHQSHVITQYSATVCKSCKSLLQQFCSLCEIKGHKCQSQQCRECGVVFDESYEQTCLICYQSQVFNAASKKVSHDCQNFAVCFTCLSSMKTCSCGSRVFTGSTKCSVCSNLLKTSELKIRKKESKVIKDWTCKFCLYSNEDSAIFCENCNSNRNWVDENPKKCSGCGLSHFFDECSKKFRETFCISCKKDIIGSQAMFCIVCKEKLKSRMCLNCKVFASFGKVFCVFCKENHWTCQCGKVNDGCQLSCCDCGLNQ